MDCYEDFRLRPTHGAGGPARVTRHRPRTSGAAVLGWGGAAGGRGAGHFRVPRLGRTCAYGSSSKARVGLKE